MKKLCLFAKNPNLNLNAFGHYFQEGLEAWALSYKKYMKKVLKINPLPCTASSLRFARFSQ